MDNFESNTCLAGRCPPNSRCDEVANICYQPSQFAHWIVNSGFLGLFAQYIGAKNEVELKKALSALTPTRMLDFLSKPEPFEFSDKYYQMLGSAIGQPRQFRYTRTLKDLAEERQHGLSLHPVMTMQTIGGAWQNRPREIVRGVQAERSFLQEQEKKKYEERHRSGKHIGMKRGPNFDTHGSQKRMKQH